MKIYAQKEYKLLMMNVGMKVITSLFLVMILAGYFTGLWMGFLKAGLGYQSLVDYYRGNEAAGFYPKSTLELLEITHFHLLSIPVVFLIVSHMISMTYLRFRTRIVFIVSGFIGMFLDLISPWLIRLDRKSTRLNSSH